MSRKREPWTVDHFVAAVRSVHPQPFRLSWANRERAKIGGAAGAAVRAGLVQRVRGRSGADWFALPEATSTLPGKPPTT